MNGRRGISFESMTISQAEEILQVSPGASPEEIKKAFRKMAFAHHPDRGGKKESFQKVNEAHQLLTVGRYRNRFASNEEARRAESVSERERKEMLVKIALEIALFLIEQRRRRRGSRRRKRTLWDYFFG